MCGSIVIGVGPLQRRHAISEPRGEPSRATVGGIDVEPEALRLREVGEVLERVDRARVRRPGRSDDRERCSTGRAIGVDRGRDRLGLEPESFVGRDAHERVGREAGDRQGPRDREVRLVGDVDPRAIQVAPAWRPIQAAQLGQPDVACDEDGHDVGHDAAAREEAEAARRVAHEVAEPANDLLLDEGRGRTGVPDVDALVDDLGKELAADRSPQRRRREVSERARVPGVHLVGGEPLSELLEEGGDRRRVRGSGWRLAGRTEIEPTHVLVARRAAQGALEAMLVEVVEGSRPGRGPEAIEGSPGDRGVADIDELRLGVPGEVRLAHGAGEGSSADEAGVLDRPGHDRRQAPSG